MQSPPDIAGFRRALVVKLRHHGDVLLTSPVFSVLKRHAPQIEVDALVYADTADMLSLHPAIDRLHCIDRDWKRLGTGYRLLAEWRLFAALRARRYDLILHLTEGWRGAWLCRLLRPTCAVGYDKRGAGRRWTRNFTHIVPWPRAGARHTVESHLDALRRIGIQPADDARALSIAPGAAASARVAALLAEHRIEAGRFVHLHPASRWQFKGWTVDGWVAIADRLHAAGWPVVVSGAPSADERAFVAAIAARLSRPPVDLVGQLNLKELAALCAAARLFVGVDSAPMHIAAATGTPAVALFGPSGVDTWRPWGTPRRGAHVVVGSDHPNHSCRPCGLDGCGGGKISDCLANLPVEPVWAAISTQLAAG